MTECCGLPWMNPLDSETPRGALERPAGCRWPKACASDRICWDAIRIEREAHQQHKREYHQAQWAGRTEAETFAEWEGVEAA